MPTKPQREMFYYSLAPRIPPGLKMIAVWGLGGVLGVSWGVFGGSWGGLGGSWGGLGEVLGGLGGSWGQEIGKIATAGSPPRPGEAKSVIRIAFLAVSGEQSRGS